MNLSKGHIRVRTLKNGETVRTLYFNYKGKQFYLTFYEEMEATECLAELREAAERRDPSVAARLAAECEREKAERQKQATARKEREEKEKQPNFRAPLEFTHKLVLPMSVSYEKMAELVRRLGNADRSQVICATRHITKPPHRVLFLGLRVPRLGSNYVFNVVRGLLGYNVTAEIIRIGERPRLRQPQPTNVTEEEEDALESICSKPRGLSRRLSVLFAENEQRIREWHNQGLAAYEIIDLLFPGISLSTQTTRVKDLHQYFRSSLCFYKKRSPLRVEMLKRWEDIKRWKEEGRLIAWMSKQLGFNHHAFTSLLDGIKENQAANARLQSTIHSDE